MAQAVASAKRPQSSDLHFNMVNLLVWIISAMIVSNDVVSRWFRLLYTLTVLVLLILSSSGFCYDSEGFNICLCFLGSQNFLLDIVTEGVDAAKVAWLQIVTSLHFPTPLGADLFLQSFSM